MPRTLPAFGAAARLPDTHIQLAQPHITGQSAWGPSALSVARSLAARRLAGVLGCGGGRFGVVLAGPGMLAPRRLAERACWYVRLMTGNEVARFADADPEYATDAAAEIDVEVVEFVAEDPQNVPADMGDSGTAEPPAGGG